MIGMPATTNVGNLVGLFSHQGNVWILGVSLKKPIGVDFTPMLSQR
jgi:hypothetical protein